MKKRIISLALVIVMLLLTLCSCSFNYAKRDLSKYASLDKDAFTNALLSIVIADGDFGVSEEQRLNKVRDTIFASLASDKGTDEKRTEGAATKYDVLYYGYYVTVTKTSTHKNEDGTTTTTETTYTLMNDGLNPAKPASVQLGLSGTEGLAALIETLVGDKSITDYVYSASAEGTTEAKDVIYVSYTRTYSVPVLDENGEPVLDASGDPKYEAKTETVNYGKVTLPDSDLAVPEGNGGASTAAAEGEGSEDTTTPKNEKTFLQSLIGQKVGKVSDYKVTENIDGTDYEVTYSGINVHWIVESEGAEIGTVEDVTYTATKKVKDVNGVEIELKDETLVYHIFPMYFVDIEDTLTPETVLEKLYGIDKDADGTVEDSEKGSLEILGSEEYKNGEDTVKLLVTKLATAYNELAAAKKALDAAIKEAEKAEQDDANKNEGKAAESTEEEPTKVEKAQADVDTKKAAVADLVTKVLAASNGEKTISEVLTKEYENAIYDNLEASYKSEIAKNIAAEVFKLAEKYITYTGKLPKRAVKDAYERIENVHKYNFYQGNYKATGSTSSSTSSMTNYEFYKGNYESFLKVALELKETDSMETAKATMMKQAEEAVKELLVVYLLADYCGDAVELTKEQKKSVKNNIYVVYLGATEEDFLHALQFDNVMNYLLEEKAEEDYAEDSVYGENKVQYKRITYTFKVEEENTEGETENG